MAHSAEGQEKSSNSYMHSVETSRNEENRAVNIFTSREFNTVLVLVRLAE